MHNNACNGGFIVHSYQVGAVFAAIIFSTTAGAQIQQGTTPKIGDESTAAIGGEMLNEFRYKGVPGIVLKDNIHVAWGTLEVVYLPAGTPLAIIRDKKLKACQSRGPFGWDKCVIDMDDDGRIERASFNDVAGAKDVLPPARYEKSFVRMPVDPRFGEGNDFRRVLVYTGVSGETLSVSYREFVNDLARPAFTENLSVPLSKTFPQTVALKDHVFELLAIDGMGLRYRLVK